MPGVQVAGVQVAGVKVAGVQVQVIPAVDVLDGKVVRLRRGRFDEVTHYGADPVETVSGWRDAGATLVHLVDLAGARDGTSNPSLWTRVAATGAGFQVGGGIRAAATAAEALAAGAARVVVGTQVVSQTEALGEIVAVVGPVRVVAALDVRSGMARGSGWTDGGMSVEGAVERVVGSGVPRALVTGVRRDGTMEGPDLAVLKHVRSLAPGLALIASGGVGTLDDLRAVREAGAEAVVVGRALYEGRFTLAEALVAAA